MTIIYLAGPMRGHDNYNFPAFDAAAAFMRDFGYTVISPAEHDRSLGFDETRNSLEGFDLGAALEWDLQQVRECDWVLLLPGWSLSTGANAELEEAEKWGKGAYEYDKTGRIKKRYGTGNVVLEPRPKTYDLTTPEETTRQALWQAQDDLMDVPMPKVDNATGGNYDAPSTAPIRVFNTGATRDTEDGKLDYVGFLSPWVLECFAEYMHKCRFLPDGTLRSSSNWRKGIPKDAYLSSMARHFIAVWKGSQASEMGQVWADPERDLCALLFNVMGLLHEHLRPDR